MSAETIDEAVHCQYWSYRCVTVNLFHPHRFGNGTCCENKCNCIVCVYIYMYVIYIYRHVLMYMEPLLFLLWSFTLIHINLDV